MLNDIYIYMYVSLLNILKENIVSETATVSVFRWKAGDAPTPVIEIICL